MVKKRIKDILFGILLASYVFFFLYWGCSTYNNIVTDKMIYKNDKNILVAKNRLNPIMQDIIESKLVEENDISELDSKIVDDYLENYGKKSFHCKYSYKFRFSDYYIELGCNYFPEMVRDFDYQCTLYMKVYYICELEQNGFESVNIDFVKLNPLFNILSNYLYYDIDSSFVERYYNKKALIDDLVSNNTFASSYNCLYNSISLFYTIRDCRGEVGSHYNKSILPEGIEGYISFSMEATIHY